MVNNNTADNRSSSHLNQSGSEHNPRAYARKVASALIGLLAVATVAVLICSAVGLFGLVSPALLIGSSCVALLLIVGVIAFSLYPKANKDKVAQNTSSQDKPKEQGLSSRKVDAKRINHTQCKYKSERAECLKHMEKLKFIAYGKSSSDMPKDFKDTVHTGYQLLLKRYKSLLSSNNSSREEWKKLIRSWRTLGMGVTSKLELLKGMSEGLEKHQQLSAFSAEVASIMDIHTMHSFLCYSDPKSTNFSMNPLEMFEECKQFFRTKNS